MTTHASPAEPQQQRHDPVTLFVAGSFALFTAFALSGAGGRMLAVAYPAGAVAVALLAYVRQPATYLGVVWWLWLVTPFVRRVFDMHYGFHPTNTILLGPLLA